MGGSAIRVSVTAWSVQGPPAVWPHCHPACKVSVTRETFLTGRDTRTRTMSLLTIDTEGPVL